MKKIIKSKYFNYIAIVIMLIGFIYLFFVNNNPDAVNNFREVNRNLQKVEFSHIHVDDESGVEELQYCTDPRVNIDDPPSEDPSIDSGILDKGFNDAGSILAVCGDIAAFVVTNELCLISLSFILVARGIVLLRKMVRVTPR